MEFIFCAEIITCNKHAFHIPGKTIFKQWETDIFEPKIYTMKHKQLTSGRFFKDLQIIAGAMLLYTIVFLAASAVLNAEALKTGFGTSPAEFYTLGGAATLAAFPLTIYFSNQLRIKLAKAKNLNEKIPIFQTNLIIQLAIVEAAVLLNIVLYFITTDVLHAGLSLLGTLFLLSKFPKKEKVIEHLAETDNDVKILNHPNSEI